MRWPRRRKRLVLTLGETYELSFPHLTRNRRKRVVLTEFDMQIDGTIRAKFMPDLHE
jgi:hypothetical protein